MLLGTMLEMDTKSFPFLRKSCYTHSPLNSQGWAVRKECASRACMIYFKGSVASRPPVNINILSYLTREEFYSSFQPFHSCQDPVPPLLPLLPDGLAQQMALVHPRYVCGGLLNFSHLLPLPVLSSFLLPLLRNHVFCFPQRPMPFVSDIAFESTSKLG